MYTNAFAETAVLPGNYRFVVDRLAGMRFGAGRFRIHGNHGLGRLLPSKRNVPRYVAGGGRIHVEVLDSLRSLCRCFLLGLWFRRAAASRGKQNGGNRRDS